MTTEPDRPTDARDDGPKTWRTREWPDDPEPVYANEMGGLGDGPDVVHYSTGVVDVWVRCERDDLMDLGEMR